MIFGFVISYFKRTVESQSTGYTTSPIVVNEDIAGAARHFRRTTRAAVHINTEGYMEVLHDSSLYINNISKEVLVARPHMNPVVCNDMKTITVL